jgi:hypothetical protein
MASLLVMIGAQGTSISAKTYRRSGQWLIQILGRYDLELWMQILGQYNLGLWMQILGRYDLGLLEGTY